MNNYYNNEFFNLLAVESRVSDVELTRAVYYGLCRMILKKTASKGKFKLPEWGLYRVKNHGARIKFNIRTQQLCMARGTKTLAFIPHKKANFYINAKAEGKKVEIAS